MRSKAQGQGYGSSDSAHALHLCSSEFDTGHCYPSLFLLDNLWTGMALVVSPHTARSALQIKEGSSASSSLLRAAFFSGAPFSMLCAYGSNSSAEHRLMTVKGSGLRGRRQPELRYGNWEIPGKKISSS